MPAAEMLRRNDITLPLLSPWRFMHSTRDLLGTFDISLFSTVFTVAFEGTFQRFSKIQITIISLDEFN